MVHQKQLVNVRSDNIPDGLFGAPNTSKIDDIRAIVGRFDLAPAKDLFPGLFDRFWRGFRNKWLEVRQQHRSWV